MAAVGKAEENGYAERFMRTIKEEEVDNQKRIHSSLGYLTPAEFETACLATLPGVTAP